MAKFLIKLVTATIGFQAQARDLDKLFEKATFKLSAQEFTAYVADDDDKREQGLMYVEKIPVNVGMLFVFDTERDLNFWMKNTLIPLQIAFLDHTGKIIDVQEMKVAESVLTSDIPTYQSHGPAQFALEMNTGWFTRHKIKAGDKLTLESKTKSPLIKRLFIREPAKQTRQ